MTASSPPEAPLDFVAGDATGLRIPAHGDALRLAGEGFLTQAFQTFGALPPDNRLARIVRFEACPGGSTGQKFLLSVEYARADPGLHTDLFVKLSRDFADPIRDRARYELEAETRFAAISRLESFPIRVPKAYFADFHHASGTGILITERIAFGSGGVEPHREKCLDHLIPDPLPHYRAILTALARLAAAHRSGRLTGEIDQLFPWDPQAAAAADPIGSGADKLRELVRRYAAFVSDYPRLFPANLRKPTFFAQMEQQVGRFVEHEAAIKRFLQSDPEVVALCHWNANIDNAWFWRDEAGELQCGLLDWGRVSQMNLAFAIWGCLSSAGLDIWDRHLDVLLALFTDELEAGGGPRLEPDELRLHLDLYVACMGLAWLMRVPGYILRRHPEVLGAASPQDPLVCRSEAVRSQLHMSTVFLDLWQRHDFAGSLDRMLARTV